MPNTAFHLEKPPGCLLYPNGHTMTGVRPIWAKVKKPLLLVLGNLHPFPYQGYPQGRSTLKETITLSKGMSMDIWRFQKVWVWTFAWPVDQISFLYEVLKLKQSFQKNKVVAGKTPFLITPQSICPNIGYRPSSFVWKCCVFILTTFK